MNLRTKIFKDINNHIYNKELKEVLPEWENFFIQLVNKQHKDEPFALRDTLNKILKDINITVKQGFQAKDIGFWVEFLRDFEYIYNTLKGKTRGTDLFN